MTLTRRRFLSQATPIGLLPFLARCEVRGLEASIDACDEAGAEQPFQHGVASGDPLSDAVIVWTRITPHAGASLAAAAECSGDETGAAPLIEVEWRIASDPAMTSVARSGVVTTDASVDYTVKVDVSGLQPGTTYYYDFRALGARSRVGRTKTTPIEGASHARLGVVSCANYPAGYFNVYRLLAERTDLDLVLHLGDYLYEYGNGTLGDGAASGRQPSPDREAVSLEDYRLRHAQYKSDADLQEMHRQHPLVATWDDHEVSNNGYHDGAANHQPDSEGDWTLRKQSAMRAYFEWMPIRPVTAGNADRVYRAFAWGDLFDLIMLDTRFAGRDARVVGNCDATGIADPQRSLLGAEQETWLLEALRGSHERGARWRLMGQQVMFAQLSDAAEGCITHPDQWDGYAQSRARVLELLRDEGLDNVVILTGDAHSSWALDIADDPFDAELYDRETGEGSRAVELVAPAVSSPGATGDAQSLLETHPHLKFADLTRNGYVLLDLTPERAQAEWYFVSTVAERALEQQLGAAFLTLDGANHLVVAPEPSLPRSDAAAPAP
jgi:alkaline phosphatase D